jgi:hypothetical protein
VEARVVIDAARRLLVLNNSDLQAIEYFIEQSIANTDSSPLNINDFKYFFILILNHRFILFVVKSGLQSLNEFYQEVSLLQIMALLSSALMFSCVDGIEIALVFVQKILKEVVDVYLSLDVVWQFTHESDVSFILYSAK